MPKSTFLNLPEEKKKKILMAAENEFLRVSYASASINKIIKVAEISRGSFYQYFEDKDDLFETIIDTHKDEIYNIFLVTLKECNGDIFDTIESCVEKMFKLRKRITNNNSQLFFQGICKLMGEPIVFEKIWGNIGEKSENCNSEFVVEFAGLIKHDNLKINNRDEVITLLSILGLIAREVIVTAFAGKTNEVNPLAVKQFKDRMESVKKHYII